MARRLNTFVYEESVAAGLPAPYFPVYAQDYYGQCAEDLIVCAILRSIAFRLGLDLAQERYLEIGGNHPIATSSSYLLHRALGMRGVIVEANPRLIDDLRRTRADATIIFGAVQARDVETVPLSVSNASELSSLDRSFVLEWDGGKVGEREVVDVPALRVNSLIATVMEGRTPVFLSIDTEGTDLDIVRDLDFTTYRPALIQIEPSDHHLPNNARHMAEFFASVGYVLAARTDYNLVFIDASLWGGARMEAPSSALTAEIALQRVQLELRASLRRTEELRAEVDATSQGFKGELDAARLRADALEAELATIRREFEGRAAAMRGERERLEAELTTIRHESEERAAALRGEREQLEAARHRLEALSAELDVFRRDASELEATSRQRQAEVETLHEQCGALRSEVAAARREAETARQDLSVARVESSDLLATVHHLEVELDATRQRSQVLTAELTSSRGEADVLRAETGLMKGSKSWRWTAPMRQAIRSWRGLRQIR